jgi:hypothetical protein
VENALKSVKSATVCRREKAFVQVVALKKMNCGRRMTMAEYIDREALLHDIEQSVVYTVREKITSAEMRGAHKVIERIKCAPAVEPIYIHEPTKSEFKRMAVQQGYAPVAHGRWDDIVGKRLNGKNKKEDWQKWEQDEFLTRRTRR